MKINNTAHDVLITMEYEGEILIQIYRYENNWAVEYVQEDVIYLCDNFKEAMEEANNGFNETVNKMKRDIDDINEILAELEPDEDAIYTEWREVELFGPMV